MRRWASSAGGVDRRLFGPVPAAIEQPPRRQAKHRRLMLAQAEPPAGLSGELSAGLKAKPVIMPRSPSTLIQGCAVNPGRTLVPCGQDRTGSLVGGGLAPI